MKKVIGIITPIHKLKKVKRKQSFRRFLTIGITFF